MHPLFGLSLVALLVSAFSAAQQPSTSGSYLSSNDQTVHLGLGAKSVVQSIEVRWPSSILQILKNAHVDQSLQVAKTLSGLSPAGGAAQK